MNIVEYTEQLADRFGQAPLFYGHGTDNPWDEACYLVLGYLGLPFDSDAGELAARQLSPGEFESLQKLADRRMLEKVPVAYLLGRAQFYGLEFVVNEDVLIPRSPIAELIVNEFSPWYTGQLENARILDMCCGCGCLGILAACVEPGASVVLSDVSTKALQLANENIMLHDLQDRVVAVESSLFEQLQGSFDIIICNPPYVDQQDMATLPAEYRHEPELALACGDDGLDLARQIFAEAADYLNPDGLLILELGNSDQHLQAQYPDIPWLWVEFEAGGIGVLVITREELLAIRSRFASK